MTRPAKLTGSTYKLRWADSAHALYVTINDIEEAGRKRPFEVFISSANMEHFAWVVALTRMISAVFRRGGEVAFVAEELKGIFDPRGGQWSEGRYVPSLIAAIGGIIERHMIETGFLPAAEAPSAMLGVNDRRVGSCGGRPGHALPEVQPAGRGQGGRLPHLPSVRLVEVQLRPVRLGSRAGVWPIPRSPCWASSAYPAVSGRATPVAAHGWAPLAGASARRPGVAGVAVEQGREVGEAVAPEPAHRRPQARPTVIGAAPPCRPARASARRCSGGRARAALHWVISAGPASRPRPRRDGGPPARPPCGATGARMRWRLEQLLLRLLLLGAAERQLGAGLERAEAECQRVALQRHDPLPLLAVQPVAQPQRQLGLLARRLGPRASVPCSVSTRARRS